MLSISLGPIALPVAPLLLLVSVWIASWIASWAASRSARTARGRQATDIGPSAVPEPLGQAIFVAAGLGLIGARIAHLLANAEPYLASPASMVDLRDGGWNPIAGAVTGAAWLVWQVWQTPRRAGPLVFASLIGVGLWTMGLMLSGARDSAMMPATALTLLEGARPMDLRTAAAGRPVVVNLWASWCGPCRQEMPALAAAQERERRVGFLFVNQGEPQATVRAHASGLGLPLQAVLLDERSELGLAVGTRGLPTTLFYDSTGALIDAHFGVLNPAALETRLQALRAAR